VRGGTGAAALRAAAPPPARPMLSQHCLGRVPRWAPGGRRALLLLPL